MRSTPRSRLRSRHSRPRQFPDDRRRRNRLAGLAGADVRAAETTGADIVGGPVLPHFDDETEARACAVIRLRAGLSVQSGPVPVIYGSGNCLIRRAGVRTRRRTGLRPALQFPRWRRYRFLLPLPPASACAFTGSRRPGSARRCRQSRTKLSWLITRGLRIGAINYHVQRKATPTVWLRARLTLKILAALATLVRPRARAVLTERERHHCHASDDGRDRQPAGGDRHRAATLQSLEDLT